MHILISMALDGVVTEDSKLAVTSIFSKEHIYVLYLTVESLV